MAQKFTPDAQDIKSLLIQSWNLIKNNPILRGPFYKLLKIHIIYCLIFYVSLSLAFYPFFGWATFIFITLLLLFIWLPLVWFITTGQQGRMSLMLYKIEKNEVFDIASINTEINQVRSKLREITWARILESTIRTSLTGK